MCFGDNILYLPSRGCFAPNLFGTYAFVIDLTRGEKSHVGNFAQQFTKHPMFEVIVINILSEHPVVFIYIVKDNGKIEATFPYRDNID